MKIDHKPCLMGLRSRLDYHYQGIRYRPTLGYNLTPDQERREALTVIQQIHDQVHQASAVDGLTFAAFIPTYLKRMRIKGRTGIARNQKLIEQHLVPFFGRLSLREIRLSHGEDYIDHRQRLVDLAGARTVADGTIERECAVLSAIINLAVEHEHVERNRLRAMPVPQGIKRERVATRDELRSLLGKASPPLRRAIVLAINIGLRQGKLVAIEQGWIRSAPDGPWLHLPAPTTRTKGNPPKIPINMMAADALTVGVVYLQRKRIFDNWSRPTSLSHEFQKLCGRCQIDGLTFHDLRHTFATALKGLGVDFEMREILLGHKLPGLVSLYSHDTPEYDRRLRMATTQLSQYWQSSLDGTSTGTRVSEPSAESHKSAEQQA